MPPKAKTLKSTITIRDMYELNESDDNILLDIKTGSHGQGSVTNVTVEFKPENEKIVIAEGLEGSFTEPVPIGTNQSLTRRVLKISTLIQDLSEDTNDTYVDISITGGKGEFHQRMEKTVSTQGEVVWFTATIKFFKVIS